MRSTRTYHRGDRVVYTAPKRSTRPGPRARDIYPEPHGEGYSYVVDKLWVVSEVRSAELVLLTRRGKTHVVDIRDPHLRPASCWERLLYRGRFPSPEGPGPLAA